jgi:hypothetical protein
VASCAGGVSGFGGLQEQHWPGWDLGSVVLVVPTGRPVVGTVAEVDACGFEKLPNKFATFGPVIIQGLVGPLARAQHAAPGNPQVFKW